MHELFQRAKALEGKLIEHRRQFHRQPEGGWREEQTAATVIAHLESLNIPYTRIGKTAIVGLIEGGLAGEKCLAIRADMDALSVHEETNLEYASQVPGMMHACGHDGHTAILMGVATLLKEQQAQLKGSVKLFFQPAEEGPGGAEPMIEGGCMENPKVTAVIGLHLNTIDYYTGELGLRAGAVSAASDGLTIDIQGYGGHGAQPHQSVDPIVCAAAVVTALQTIVSREMHPLHSAVVTIGTINGGTRGNVIADKINMKGTIRTLDPKDRELMAERIQRLVDGVCAAYRCTATIDISYGYPSVMNDPEMTDFCEVSVRKVLGADKVIRIPYPSMGGEDFSFFAQKAPGCFLRLGARNDQLGCNFPGHHPKYNFDEAAIAYGVAAMTQIAVDYLK